MMYFILNGFCNTCLINTLNEVLMTILKIFRCITIFYEDLLGLTKFLLVKSKLIKIILSIEHIISNCFPLCENRSKESKRER